MKTFEDLSLGNKVYILNSDGPYPVVNRATVTGLHINDNPELVLDTTHGKYFIEFSMRAESIAGRVYLQEEDLLAALEKECISRIIKLSKIVGRSTDES